VSLLLVLLVLIAVFMFFNTRDTFKRYAMQTVEDHWQEELTKPGSMDLIQKTVSVEGVCIAGVLWLHSTNSFIYLVLLLWTSWYW